MIEFLLLFVVDFCTICTKYHEEELNYKDRSMAEGLDRFLKAQESTYDRALAEIRSGRKTSHWMWYIFPQVKGLGFSPTSEYYGISGIREAKEYINHPLLRKRLIEISEALCSLDETDPEIVMGYPDDLKLCSCMTLFSEAAQEEDVFARVLKQYFKDQKDTETLKRIAISVDQMRRSDAYTIEHFVSGRDLMYRAAEGVYSAYGRWQDKRIAIIVGGGNNGGDGYALSVVLKKAGIDSDVLMASDKRSDDGDYYYEKAKGMDVRILRYEDKADLSGYNVIVDCLLGTGFAGEVRDDIRNVIKDINNANAYVISVDINSGLNGDTGEGKAAVRSDLTVSIGYYKHGMFKGNASGLIGRLVNADIGIELVD